MPVNLNRFNKPTQQTARANNGYAFNAANEANKDVMAVDRGGNVLGHNQTLSGIAIQGDSNAYTMTCNTFETSYYDNLTVSIKPDKASTDAPTLNINGIGAVPLLTQSGSAVSLKAGVWQKFTYTTGTDKDGKATANFIQSSGGSDSKQGGSKIWEIKDSYAQWIDCDDSFLYANTACDKGFKIQKINKATGEVIACTTMDDLILNHFVLDNSKIYGVTQEADANGVSTCYFYVLNKSDLSVSKKIQFDLVSSVSGLIIYFGCQSSNYVYFGVYDYIYRFDKSTNAVTHYSLPCTGCRAIINDTYLYLAYTNKSYQTLVAKYDLDLNPIWSNSTLLSTNPLGIFISNGKLFVVDNAVYQVNETSIVEQGVTVSSYGAAYYNDRIYLLSTDIFCVDISSTINTIWSKYFYPGSVYSMCTDGKALYISNGAIGTNYIRALTIS